MFSASTTSSSFTATLPLASLIVDEQKLYKPFRVMYARFAMVQQDVDERCVWWHGPQAW
jgi:hypothetical protein